VLTTLVGDSPRDSPKMRAGRAIHSQVPAAVENVQGTMKLIRNLSMLIKLGQRSHDVRADPRHDHRFDNDNDDGAIRDGSRIS